MQWLHTASVEALIGKRYISTAVCLVPTTVLDIEQRLMAINAHTHRGLHMWVDALSMLDP